MLLEKVLDFSAGVCSEFVPRYDFIGPFPMGKTEIDGDPIAAVGGIWNITRGSNSFKLTRYRL
jgi:hypothetical protein